MAQLPLKFQALKEIAELSPEGIFLYDVGNRTISYGNALAFKMLGLREGTSESDLMALFERLAPEDQAYLKGQYLGSVKQSGTEQSEFRLTTKGGKVLVVCCTAYLLDSTLVVFIRDITQPKNHEDYLVEFGARKNTMLDILVHHLSGALSLMKNLSAEATKHLNTGDKNLKVFFELLNNNNAHCLDLINNLLRNEHERSPQIDIKSSRIDIVAKVALIHDELQKSHKNRIFEFVHIVDSFFITTDEVKVLQVINNLISNALKFSTSDQPILIAISENPSDIIVSIKDKGIGIPEPLAPFIFDRQSVASRTGLQGERSTGFGLSICKKLITLLNGRIWFESEINKGSTFYFSLPKN